MIDVDLKENATVRIESGMLQGAASADGAVRVFKGIPYAAPPVGELRWRTPQLPPAWAGVRRADTFGPICPQFGPPPGSFYQQRYGPRTHEFLRLYPVDADADAPRAQIRAMSDQLFAGMRAWAEAQQAHSPQKAYLYYFDRKLPGRDSAFFGAFHSSELYYVFGTLDSTARPWEPADRRLAHAMTSYWANFAATGDPNGAGLPAWPAFGEAPAPVMELGEHIQPMQIPYPEKMEFLAQEIAEWIERG